MPFKTKRQKIAASARRFSFSESGLVSYESEGKQLKSDTAVESKRVKTARPAPLDEIGNLSYIKADLVKITLAATFIIASQIILASLRA